MTSLLWADLHFGLSCSRCIGMNPFVLEHVLNPGTWRVLLGPCPFLVTIKCLCCLPRLRFVWVHTPTSLQSYVILKSLFSNRHPKIRSHLRLLESLSAYMKCRNYPKTREVFYVDLIFFFFEILFYDFFSSFLTYLLGLRHITVPKLWFLFPLLDSYSLSELYFPLGLFWRMLLGKEEQIQSSSRFIPLSQEL